MPATAEKTDPSVHELEQRYAEADRRMHQLARQFHVQDGLPDQQRSELGRVALEKRLIQHKIEEITGKLYAAE